MRKLVILILVYHGMAIMIQSCCNAEYALTDAGQVSIIDVNQNILLEGDTIQSEFEILMDFEISVVTDFNINIMNTALAFQCIEVLTNSIDSNLIEIQMDKEFSFEGELIEAGTDLMKVNKIANVVLDTVYNTDFYAERKIHFTKDFIDEVEIEEGIVSIKIVSHTSDNREIVTELKRYIKI